MEEGKWLIYLQLLYYTELVGIAIWFEYVRLSVHVFIVISLWVSDFHVILNRVLVWYKGYPSYMYIPIYLLIVTDDAFRTYVYKLHLNVPSDLQS